jgi:hypothetical protein
VGACCGLRDTVCECVCVCGWVWVWEGRGGERGTPDTLQTVSCGSQTTALNRRGCVTLQRRSRPQNRSTALESSPARREVKRQRYFQEYWWKRALEPVRATDPHGRVGRVGSGGVRLIQSGRDQLATWSRRGPRETSQAPGKKRKEKQERGGKAARAVVLIW